MIREYIYFVDDNPNGTSGMTEEEVVRCKDCKWGDWYKTVDGKQLCYCTKTGNGGRTEDDFCSYGERSEE